jgi:hypothetical protein
MVGNSYFGITSMLPVIRQLTSKPSIYIHSLVAKAEALPASFDAARSARNL